MTPVKIGVLGCASVARRFVLPAMKKTETVELVAVASRTRDKAQSFGFEFGCDIADGYDELLSRDNIDAIYLPLPTGMHAEWARRTLEAGKHLYIEKSLGMNLAEAEAMVSLARERDLALKENYMFEYHPQQAVVRDAMENEAGTIRLFRATFGFPPLPADNFRYDPVIGGGALLDAGGYVLKALGVFFPGSTARVLAATLSYGPSGADIAGAAMLEVEVGGKTIPAHLGFGFDHHYQCGIEIWGSKAKISTNRTFSAGPAIIPAMRIETASGSEERQLPQDDHFAIIIAAFADAIQSGNHEADYQAILTQARLQEELRKAAGTRSKSR